MEQEDAAGANVQDHSAESSAATSPTSPTKLKNDQDEDTPNEEETAPQEDLTPWDADWWNSTLRRAQATKDREQIEAAFERLLKKFPSSARHWILYIEYEIGLEDNGKVQALFTRCLRSVLNIDLWRLYLDYIKRVNSPEKGVSPQDARPVLVQAYEFVLSHVGLDLYSTPVWKDFLEYIKTWHVNNPFENAHRMDALRKTFHRAICIPMDQLEHIWRDYDLFENTVNKLTGKKSVSEKSPGYMTARAAIRDLKAMHEPLARFVMASPPSWLPGHLPIQNNNDELTLSGVVSSEAIRMSRIESDRKQAHAWLTLIEWEKKNPLHYDDKPSVIARVMYAYRQALISLRLYPQLWRDAACFLLEQGQEDDADAILSEGLECCPDSLLLSFYAAELAEEKGDSAKVKSYYENLLKLLQSHIEKLQPQMNELTLHLEMIEMEKQRLLERMALPDDQRYDSADNEMMAQEYAAFKTVYDSLTSKANIAWIQYMKYCRRTDGIKSARQIFSRARKTVYCNAHVFIASALMEYYCNKDQQIAFKIFEVGMKTFGSDLKYVLTYLEHLINVNDDSNSRSLFEQSISKFTPAEALPLWEMIWNYENQYGDLTTVRQIEHRKAEAYGDPKDSSVSLAKRYSFRGMNYIMTDELGIEESLVTDSAMRIQATPQITLPVFEDENEVVVLSVTREQEMLNPPRPQALSTINTHPFAKPDLGSYGAYKAPEVAAEFKQRQIRPIPHPSATEIAMKQAPLIAQQAVPILPPKPKPMPAPLLGPQWEIPSAIAKFLDHLPLPRDFQGPVFPVEAFINIITNAVIPPPSIPPPQYQQHPYGAYSSNATALGRRSPPSYPDRYSQPISKRGRYD